MLRRDTCAEAGRRGVKPRKHPGDVDQQFSQPHARAPARRISGPHQRPALVEPRRDVFAPCRSTSGPSVSPARAAGMTRQGVPGIWVVRVPAQSRCCQRNWRRASARRVVSTSRKPGPGRASDRWGVSRARGANGAVSMASENPHSSDVVAVDGGSCPPSSAWVNSTSGGSAIHPSFEGFLHPRFDVVWAGDAPDCGHRRQIQPYPSPAFSQVVP